MAMKPCRSISIIQFAAQPIRSLVAFKRVNVAKGTTLNIDFDIPVERFHCWSFEKKAYVVDADPDDIQIVASR